MSYLLLNEGMSFGGNEYTVYHVILFEASLDLFGSTLLMFFSRVRIPNGEILKTPRSYLSFSRTTLRIDGGLGGTYDFLAASC